MPWAGGCGPDRGWWAMRCDLGGQLLVSPPYPPRAINYHHILDVFAHASRNLLKWCIGQEAMKMYGFLIPLKGAKGIHAAETLIINVVPVISTIWEVYIFTFVFKCVFGTIKSISLRTYSMPKDNVGETLCFLSELSVATSQGVNAIVLFNFFFKSSFMTENWKMSPKITS